MERRRIGSLEVSVVGVGCNNFGGRIDEAATLLVVDAALEVGINFFDTADIYGDGKSEEFLGRALGPRRKDVIVATKFGYKKEGWPGGAAPEHVKTSCDASLSRLGTDVIDLFQQHVPDPEVPVAETLGALEDLVKAGKVREIGCSNFDVPLLREAEQSAKSVRFVSVQNELSLLKRGSEADVLAECQAKGLGYLPFFPLASGMLTGKYRQGSPLPEGTRIKDGSPWLTQENIGLTEKLIAYAESKGRTILELAFGWLLSHQPVSSVIAGATKPDQIQSNVAAANWKLGDSERAEVDAILSAS